MSYRIKGEPAHRVAWYKGPKGLGAYTVKPIDNEGNFGVYYFKPTGPGARKGKAREYTRVPRLDTKRKSKRKAIDRAYAMAYGKERRELEPVKRSEASSDPMIGYCVAERKRVRVESWTQNKAKSGRDQLSASCPNCGTGIVKYGRLIDCPECGERKPVAAGDYICKSCRAAMD